MQLIKIGSKLAGGKVVAIEKSGLTIKRGKKCQKLTLKQAETIVGGSATSQSLEKGKPRPEKQKRKRNN